MDDFEPIDELIADETVLSGDEPRPRRRIRVIPLVFGVAFAVTGVSAIVADAGNLDLDVRWLWAIALAVLGVGGLAASLDGLRRSQRASW